MTTDCLEIELEKRLNLYQRFVKIYEHHGSLIEEILQIENTHPTHPTFNPETFTYFIEAVIEESEVALITNLSNQKTQRFVQPQQIWIFGREQTSGIFLSNPDISRHHAMIQYIESQRCFYFQDFGSTNGSFINGKPVFEAIELQDGDRIRMGTLTVTFFVNASTQMLPPLEDEILTQLHTDRETLKTLMTNCHHTCAKTRLIRYEQEATVNFLHESQRTYSENHEIIKLLESSHDETSQYFDCLLQGNLYGNSVLSKDCQNKSGS